MAWWRMRRVASTYTTPYIPPAKARIPWWCFDDKGKFVKSWGKEFKGGAHGLHIQKEGGTEFLYMCDTARGVVVKAILDGEQVYSIGYPDVSEAYKPGADGKK